MIKFKYILLIISLCFIYASCMKDDHFARDVFPFGCYVESTRNGEFRKFNWGGFGFSNQMSFYHNPNGDSLLSVSFSNKIAGTNEESINFTLAKEDEDFVREYDLNKEDSLREKFKFIFHERYLSKATYVLDSTFPNKFEITSITDDKKQIRGKFDFRVVMIEADNVLHSHWAPDTIHHSNAVFWINYFE